MAAVFLLSAALVGMAHGNPTTGGEVCCAAHNIKLERLEAMVAEQEKLIQQLTVRVNSLQSNVLSAGKDCAYGWVKHGQTCYYFETTPQIWEGARDACKQKGGALVSVESFEEDLFITTSLKSIPDTTRLEGYFTSGKEVSRKSWVWMSTGQAMLPYAPWAGREGPGQDHSQDCHVYWTADHMRWHDFHCSAKTVGSVCEKPL